jgi:hypothetical protein
METLKPSPFHPCSIIANKQVITEKQYKAYCKNRNISRKTKQKV